MSSSKSNVIYNYLSSGNLIIYGGSFSSTSSGNQAIINNNGTLTLGGVTISNEGYGNNIVYNSGTANIWGTTESPTSLTSTAGLIGVINNTGTAYLVGKTTVVSTGSNAIKNTGTFTVNKYEVGEDYTWPKIYSTSGTGGDTHKTSTVWNLRSNAVFYARRGEFYSYRYNVLSNEGGLMEVSLSSVPSLNTDNYAYVKTYAPIGDDVGYVAIYNKSGTLKTYYGTRLVTGYEYIVCNKGTYNPRNGWNITVMTNCTDFTDEEWVV